MKALARYRDPQLLRALAAELGALDPGRPLTLMHVCGTHENALGRFGLRSLLPAWLRVIAGPGCPVCVCPPSDIALAVSLALEHEAVVATFGDMVPVPGRISLAEARARGGDVRVVLGVADAVALARANAECEVVMLAVGFETTACTTAAAVLAHPPPNFSLLASHRTIPAAMDALLRMDDLSLDGFLLPGHVTTVIGADAYRGLAAAHHRPMVVAGFEPVDILYGLLELVREVISGGAEVRNAYPRATSARGNTKALALMDEVFEVVDARWRGLGLIPGSGLGLRDASRDAEARFGLVRDESLPDVLPGCRCSEVMIGLCEPEDCPLFRVTCSPDHPRGACMVTFEGTCRNRYTFGEGR